MLKIEDFISKITHAYPGLREIWLLASPAGGRGRHSSGWKILAFAEEDIFHRLRSDVRFRRREIELLVVRNGDEFCDPWDDQAEPGYLSEWEWVKISNREAHYYATKWVQDEKLGRAIIERCKASLLWPADKK